VTNVLVYAFVLPLKLDNVVAGGGIYKLFVDNYLYNFDCYVGERNNAATGYVSSTIPLILHRF
jgi:hypothetical protein